MSLIKVNSIQGQRGGREWRNASPLSELSAQLPALPSCTGFVLRPPGAAWVHPWPCSMRSAGGLPGTASPSQPLPVCPAPISPRASRGCWLLAAGFWLLGRLDHGAHRKPLRLNIISIGSVVVETLHSSSALIFSSRATGTKWDNSRAVSTY